ncbi:Protein of unknown function [Gryllus bimaculatus]|nr:Protein of unknown function [Gryllus bimaculatus]
MSNDGTFPGRNSESLVFEYTYSRARASARHSTLGLCVDKVVVSSAIDDGVAARPGGSYKERGRATRRIPGEPPGGESRPRRAAPRRTAPHIGVKSARGLPSMDFAARARHRHQRSNPARSSALFPGACAIRTKYRGTRRQVTQGRSRRLRNGMSTEECKGEGKTKLIHKRRVEARRQGRVSVDEVS